jgi:hypothetical protein
MALSTSTEVPAFSLLHGRLEAPEALANAILEFVDGIDAR